MTLLEILLMALCAAVSVGAAWLLFDRSYLNAEKARSAAQAEESRAALEATRGEADGLRGRVRELELESARHEEKAAAMERAREGDAEKLKQLREAFDAMAGEALDKSAERFLKLAGQTFEKHRETAKKEHEERAQAVEKLVEPIGESLKKTDEQLKKLEAERLKAQSRLAERFEIEEQQRRALAEETRRLSDALRKPEVRGRYGEIQLQRVAEVAGMTAYCDFATQASVKDGDGRTLRPDMIVRMPNERVVVVDAKANIEPYLRALEAETADEQEMLLERFAEGVSKQARDLSRKEYWAQFDGSPEFVVMFVPGDQFVDAALARRPTLLEDAAAQKVILASPSTLIGLLRAVSVGWREQAISERAKELLELGHELHERSAVLVDHVSRVGRGLDTAVNSYNKLVGSIDRRLMPTLRKFEEAGAKSSKTLDESPQIEVKPQLLAAAETAGAGGGSGGSTGSGGSGRKKG